MDALEEQQYNVYHTKIDSSGRIVIPAEVRERLHIGTGDVLVVVEDKQGLHLKSVEQALAEAQRYFANLAPPDVLLSDEIIADRRSERERD